LIPKSSCQPNPNKLRERKEKAKSTSPVEARIDLVSYQREASLTVWSRSTLGIMMAFGRWIVVEHFVIDAPFYIGFVGSQVHCAIIHNTESTTVKCLLGLNYKAVWRFLPSRLNYPFLIILIDGQGRARDRKLNEEDKEEYHHVEEQKDLVMSDSPDESNDRDHEEEDAASCDASHNGQRSHNP